MEVGAQRLPPSAYPELQTRGLKYGSLWLTFHGMQWPYMPSVVGGPRFVIGLSGWGWIDNAYEKFAPWGNNTNIEADRIKYWKQQARMLFRVTPTYALDREHFIQGQVELVGTGDQTISRSDVGGADTDDLYLRFGKWNAWDVQFGRFEGWEVFHLGMGLDQNTFERQGAVGPGESAYPISFYGLTDNQFRPLGAAGNVALHYYPLPILRVELLGMAGSLSGPAYATRPVAILDLGWLKLKGGVEYKRLSDQHEGSKGYTDSRGGGGSIQLVFDPRLELGVSGAYGLVDRVAQDGTVDEKGSNTTYSVGGFANAQLIEDLVIGGGVNYTYLEDTHFDPMLHRVEHFNHTQTFGAI